MKKFAYQLVPGDFLANGDGVLSVDIVGDMVEVDFVTCVEGIDEGVSVVIPRLEEFEVIA